MAIIAIKGIRFKELKIEFTADGSNISGEYQLVSTADKVLATNPMGGYSGLKVNVSGDTIKKLEDFVKSYKNEINTLLGLDSE